MMFNKIIHTKDISPVPVDRSRMGSPFLEIYYTMKEEHEVWSIALYLCYLLNGNYFHKAAKMHAK